MKKILVDKNILSLIILTSFVVAATTYIVLAYVGQPILESYGFRQTQTAVTVFWMNREGLQLNYQTPVGGYPWSIPFEFPIYQFIVAVVIKLCGIKIDIAGRLVSYSFLLACIWPAFAISRRLNFSRETPWIFISLLTSTPIYVFWGRSFMIETVALFFSVASIPYALDLRDKNPKLISATLFCVFATLGFLQKVTTALPVILFFGAFLLVQQIVEWKTNRETLIKFLKITMAFSVPFIAIFLWTHYTDAIKSHNALGLKLTSQALTSWNFGTLNQHIDWTVWKKIIVKRTFIKNTGGFLGLLLIIGGLVSGDERIVKPLFACIVLFLLPILIFLNLHYIHDYYQVSTVIYLIAGIAISLGNWRPAFITANTNIVQSSAGLIGLTAILVITNFYFLKGHGWKDISREINPANSEILYIAEAIKKYTPENSGIVVYGYNWSSEFVYYAERKGFSVPDWFDEYSKVWAYPESFLGGKKLGALVFCTGMGDRLEASDIIRHPIADLSHLFKIDKCYLWLPNTNTVELPERNKLYKPLVVKD